ncbi:MAG: aminomethyl-transferring glycine dehydrogenase subunit GcvPA [Steroidobacteraceae bacterium]
MPFIPHTDDDVREMLGTIGVAGIDDLFDEIPPALRLGDAPLIPPALTEAEVGRLTAARARQDGRLVCFAGAGAYDHHVPAAVWAIASRGEYYSAYTPYQAEASQGTLQTIYEYQSMIAGLTGMAASNASLYDGASALSEAVLMAVRANRRSKSHRMLIPATVHPHYRQVATSVGQLQDVHFETVTYRDGDGRVASGDLEAHGGGDVTALVIQQPNFFGALEDVDTLTDWAHARGALVIAVVNPMSLAILKPPGQWGRNGADIVVGEGQPLGVPLSGGGPYFGFMTTRTEHLRQMPGRIVGRTVDADGREGFTLTLQAREQHIRRGKATSNICTNQALLVTAATIYLSLLGPTGLERVAAASHARCNQLVGALSAIPGVRLAFDGPRFNEAVLQLDRPVAPVLQALAARGILGGVDLATWYPELGPALLVCATETRTDADIEAFAAALSAVLAAPGAA